MKQLLFFLLSSFLLTPSVFADEFVVKSFKQINNKILTNNQKVYDDNDELCAIVMVRTSLVDLGISASTPIVGSPKRIEGDYRVHLSAGTRMIKFFKDGFSTFEYIFPEKIEKGNFYIVELEYRRTDVTVTGNTMGFVLINSDPQGADVYINDEATGLQTPFQNPYNEGYYSYSIKMSQYLIHNGEFTITPDETQKLDVNLKPDFGSLSLTYYPENEIVLKIDGTIIDKQSPINIEKMTPGVHTLSLSRIMYDTHTQDFTINREQNTSLNINLEPNFGSLELIIIPASSLTVSIDGMPSIQNSPYKIQQLTPGKHTISVSKNKYVPYQKEIIISKGGSSIINIDLEPNFGDLFISTTPEVNAKVIIDNVEYDETTPLTLSEFTTGKHSLRLTKSMYMTHEQEFIIENGIPKTLEISLSPTFGIIEISIDNEADIYIDKQKKGRGSYTGKLLKGIHLIEIKREFYYSESKQIEIKSGEQYNEQFTLKPKRGTISIMTNPAEADIYLNDEFQGQSPKFINNIMVGNYELKIKRQGFATINKQIDVSENQTLTINEILQSATGIWLNANSTDTTSISIGEEVQFLYNFGDVDSFKWTFEGSETIESTEQNPTLLFNEAGTFAVQLEVFSSTGKKIFTQNSYVIVVDDTDIKALSKFNKKVFFADELYNKQFLSKALLNYELAAEVIFDNIHVNNRIIKIKSTLLTNAKYNNIIAEADKQFENEQYVTAKASYTTAIEINSNNSYPKEMLIKLDRILSVDNSAFSVNRSKNNTFHQILVSPTGYTINIKVTIGKIYKDNKLKLIISAEWVNKKGKIINEVDEKIAILKSNVNVSSNKVHIDNFNDVNYFAFTKMATLKVRTDKSFTAGDINILINFVLFDDETRSGTPNTVNFINKNPSGDLKINFELNKYYKSND